MALRILDFPMAREFPEPREIPATREFPMLKLFPPVSRETGISREFPARGFPLNIAGSSHTQNSQGTFVQHLKKSQELDCPRKKSAGPSTALPLFAHAMAS